MADWFLAASLWQIIAIYIVIAATFIFVSGLYLVQDPDDDDEMMMFITASIFWPATAIFAAFCLLIFVCLYLPYAGAIWCSKRISPLSKEQGE